MQFVCFWANLIAENDQILKAQSGHLVTLIIHNFGYLFLNVVRRTEGASHRKIRRIHLRLPSCGPGFESQAHHVRFNSQICNLFIILLKKGRNKQTSIQYLQQINVKNVHLVYCATIRTHNLQDMSLLP